MFEARPITKVTLRAAFAVMQIVRPDILFEDFRHMVAAARLEGLTGIVVGLFDRRDYVHALFRAQHEQKLCRPSRLNIVDFICADTVSTSIMLEMIDALENWVQNIGCDRIALEASRSEATHRLPLTDILVARGFLGESVLMVRRV